MSTWHHGVDLDRISALIDEPHIVEQSVALLTAYTTSFVISAPEDRDPLNHEWITVAAEISRGDREEVIAVLAMVLAMLVPMLGRATEGDPMRWLQWVSARLLDAREG